MKTTYKLLGSFWDKMPYENEKITYISFPTEKAHHVLLTNILSSKSLEEVEHILIQNKNNFSIVIDVDFAPESGNKTINNFFEKRISQISAFLRHRYKEVYFYRI